MGAKSVTEGLFSGSFAAFLISDPIGPSGRPSTIYFNLYLVIQSFLFFKEVFK